MKKYMFVEVNRYNCCNSNVQFVEGENEIEVLTSILKNEFELEDEDIKEELKTFKTSTDSTDSTIFGCDSEESSFMLIEIK